MVTLSFILLATSVPFRVRVNFDSDEHNSGSNVAIVDTNASDGEYLTRPGGIIGMITSLHIV